MKTMKRMYYFSKNDYRFRPIETMFCSLFCGYHFNRYAATFLLYNQIIVNYLLFYWNINIRIDQSDLCRFFKQYYLIFSGLILSQNCYNREWWRQFKISLFIFNNNNEFILRYLSYSFFRKVTFRPETLKDTIIFHIRHCIFW